MFHAFLNSLQKIFASAKYFFYFLSLGVSGWGGIAIISAVEDFFVERTQKLSKSSAVETIAIAWLMPGTVTVNAIANLHHRAWGSSRCLAYTIATMTPCICIVLSLAIIYQRSNHTLPNLEAALIGIIPIVSATILNVAWKQGIHTIQDKTTTIIAALSALALYFFHSQPWTPIIAIIGSGILGWFFYRKQYLRARTCTTPAPIKHATRSLILAGLLMLVSIGAHVLIAIKGPTYFGIWSYPLVCVALGLTLFGGGFVAIPILEHLVVDVTQWISSVDFAASITAAQLGPGPILGSTMFIGYQVAGIIGVLGAIFGIFILPACLINLVGQIISPYRAHPYYQAATQGIKAAVTGLIATSAYLAFHLVETTAITLGLFIGALLALRVFKLSTTILFLASIAFSFAISL